MFYSNKLKAPAILFGVLSLLAVFTHCSHNTITIGELTVEYAATPLGIDVKTPRFAWQMQTQNNERGYFQTAYQVEVKNPSGESVWNSGKVNSSTALGIPYAGSPLQPATKYDWTVTVWDQNTKEHTTSSWFETGLLNPDAKLVAWDGAQWIGGIDEDLVLFAQYQMIFGFTYTLAVAEGSTKAGFVYGANDQRLMNKYKNNFQLENKKNESYIKLELDVSNVTQSPNGLAKLNIYRVGYTKEDNVSKPFATFSIKSSVINSKNKNNKHVFKVNSAFGRIKVLIDETPDFFIQDKTYHADIFPFETERDIVGAAINLNPLGLGGDYIPFGMVCDIGFALEPGQKAEFSSLEIFNDRAPSATLFKENLSTTYNGIFKNQLSVTNGSYVVDGGSKGAFIVANPSRNSAPMLRTKFETTNEIKSARLYVTARGIYEMYINGEKVGNDFYTPGLTQYNKTHMYQTYDVTTKIKRGSNAMGALMAEGWWSGLMSYGPVWNHFGDRQSLLAKLVIDYSDGSKKILTTNNSEWKYFNHGPIVYSSLDQGEIYDATREASVNGWSTPEYDDANWKPATVISLKGTSFSTTENESASTEALRFDNMQLVGQLGNNAEVFKTLTAQHVTEVQKGIFVYDMGQNFVGVPKISFATGHAGDTIILRVSEMLYPNLPESGNNVGMIMTENYRAALCKDMYIMKDGAQVFQPKFTSRGYQFIEITGLNAPLPLEAVQGIAISSVRKLTADYNTSNKKVNQLWSNLVWSNVDNFLSIPTDCPQRNERMGWSGDISVFSRTATYVSNAESFLRRHMLAMRDLQHANGKFTDVAPIGGGFGGVLWGSAGITVAWEVYQQYNDVALLEEHYSAMASYVDYLETTIDPKTGITSDGQLGDWLGPQNNLLGTPFLTTAYHIYDLWIMKNVAEVLGKKEDAARFSQMHDRRKEYFNKTYINEEGKTIGLVGGPWEFMSSPNAKATFKVADTQTSYAVALALGAFSDEKNYTMAQHLAEAVRRRNTDDNNTVSPEYSLMTGFIGTAWISKALSDHGYTDDAYRLLQNDKFPSWLYAIDQGATTIWERLNGYTVEKGFDGNNRMNSFNHYSFGAVGQWMIAYSLGITRDEPGFQKFILRPEPDPTGQMKWAEGWYDGMYGRINSRWQNDNGKLTYEATVPANTTATLYLPAKSEKDVKENGIAIDKSNGIEFIKFEKGKAVYKLQSGKYKFETSALN